MFKTQLTQCPSSPRLAFGSPRPPNNFKAKGLAHLVHWNNSYEFTAKPDSTFTDQDPIVFPTGPHQRIAEELGCTRLSGGFRNYVDFPNKNNSFGGNKSSNSR
ncbi:hypothetical protein JHK86_016483 [Glycine max]|nr:hypothetical protein JHK86_016483 [Glycine max]